jgi:hypothetical protein
MKRIFIMSAMLISALILSAPVHAIDSKSESWYTYWEFGYAKTFYPKEVQDKLDVIKEIPGMNHNSVNAGVLGFYWPLKDNKTIMGGIIDANADQFEYSGKWMQMNQYQLSFSTMHFINTIGKGFFLRGDIGFSKLLVQEKGKDQDNSDTGFGLLFGGGYAIPVTPGTRILLNANYALRRIEGDIYSRIAFNIGGMF